MQDRRLGVVETRFAELIWSHAPISSGELVHLCSRELEWKKSTTYTVLKKLCDQGLFENRNGQVKVLVDRDSYMAMQSRQFVQETFAGSLPAFLAAFTARKSLTAEEVQQIRRMIAEFEED